MSEPPTVDDIREGYESDASLRSRLADAIEFNKALKQRIGELEDAERSAFARAEKAEADLAAAKDSMAPLMAKCAALLAQRDAWKEEADRLAGLIREFLDAETAYDDEYERYPECIVIHPESAPCAMCDGRAAVLTRLDEARAALRDVVKEVKP